MLFVMSIREVLIGLLFVNQYVDGEKILGIFAHKGKSHFDSFVPLMKALALKGHDVTVISHFPQKTRVANFSDIDINPGNIFLDVINLGDIPENYRVRRYATPLLLLNLGYESCKQVFSNKNFISFFNSAPKFDLIITELFNTKCFLGALRQLNAPIIGMSSTVPLSWDDFTVGFPSNPAYIPNNFMSFNDKMTFLQRTENTIAYLLTGAINHLHMAISGYLLANVVSESPHDLNEIASNISLMLVNAHFSVQLPRPLPPNYIEVGGLHLTQPKIPPSAQYFRGGEFFPPLPVNGGTILKIAVHVHASPVNPKKRLMVLFQYLVLVSRFH
ncbi:UDP-glucuronosyltransferase 1-7C-like [Photinus pyralis]|uniref:UDP-glucuronosyltransferase 1-7C-like n=1 Tax=Photinus pyralis TaxID=7054 RepID=UPI0012671523|nr:UDP-glucuronosyltransferase 1-7C-like [Photinus pyralis]